MNRYRKNVIATSASFPKEPYYHHCMPVAQVKHGTILADPAFSYPGFMPAYEWLDDELGFFPLFCAVGVSDAVIRMTGYADNWRVLTGGEFVFGKYQKIYRREGEFPNLALFSFDHIDGVFMDFMSWHIALNACMNGRAVSNAEKKMIFKPSWTKSRWIQAALHESHSVQLVTQELPLDTALKVRVRNAATRQLLEEKGFRNAEIFRLRVDTSPLAKS
jgi:hypothetical protein